MSLDAALSHRGATCLAETASDVGVTRRDAPLTLSEVERAIYIDFEGTAVDPPSLLGALWVDGDDDYFIQYVVEPQLWPAARAKSGAEGRFCEPANWDDLTEIRLLAEDEGRRVIAWSNHESEDLATHVVAEDDREWFRDNVLNAIPIARRWKRVAFPDVVFNVDPKNPMRGRHQLQRYFDLIGYSVPSALGPGNSAQRIRYVRNMLEKKDGQFAALTPTAKAKWTKALEHNLHDCKGLRALMVRCAGPRSKPQTQRD